MQNMQSQIERANERFQRNFFKMNIVWIGVSLITITVAANGTFQHHPAYLHDWHLFAIAGLSIVVLSVYVLGILGRSISWKPRPTTWPAPLSWSLPTWITLYTGFMLLSLIDSSFVWSFFILFGISFAMFGSWRLIVAVSIIYVTFILLLGALTWPLSNIDFGSMFGIGVSFFSFTTFAMLVQHLIGERYERNQLIEQLTQAHSELEEANRRLADTVAQEQELAVLRERTRLAREMHDTLGHALALISIKIEAARRLRERDPERCDHELEATGEIVRASMNDLRASIANLRSPALEREPACRAIARYAREMAQRTGLRVTYDLREDIEGLPEAVEETLWKVGQEALTNVEKHARAQNVTLHISRRDGSITMRIEDDGVGLPAALRQCHAGDDHHHCASPQGHYGLSGMYERVASMEGHISLRSPDTLGTIVEVQLPLVEAPLPGLQSETHVS